jgi:hypothetical protein
MERPQEALANRRTNWLSANVPVCCRPCVSVPKNVHCPGAVCGPLIILTLKRKSVWRSVPMTSPTLISDGWISGASHQFCIVVISLLTLVANTLPQSVLVPTRNRICFRPRSGRSRARWWRNLKPEPFRCRPRNAIPPSSRTRGAVDDDREGRALVKRVVLFSALTPPVALLR